MMSEEETGLRKAGVIRRDALKGAAGAAATVAAAVVATPALGAAEAAPDPEKNPYGGGPGTGISLPPYFRPTDGLKNNNVYYPGAEELGEDEMRISFVGSAPWPPRRDQAGTCIMVELGNGKRFFFDFGSGCMRNIVALQLPVGLVNDIFLTHSCMSIITPTFPTCCRSRPRPVCASSRCA